MLGGGKGPRKPEPAGEKEGCVFGASPPASRSDSEAALLGCLLLRQQAVKLSMSVLRAVPAGQSISAGDFSPRAWGVSPLEGRTPNQRA